jgi:hypothetical protein
MSERRVLRRRDETRIEENEDYIKSMCLAPTSLHACDLKYVRP